MRQAGRYMKEFRACAPNGRVTIFPQIWGANRPLSHAVTPTGSHSESALRPRRLPSSSPCRHAWPPVRPLLLEWTADRRSSVPAYAAVEGLQARRRYHVQRHPDASPGHGVRVLVSRSLSPSTVPLLALTRPSWALLRASRSAQDRVRCDQGRRPCHPEPHSLYGGREGSQSPRCACRNASARLPLKTKCSKNHACLNASPPGSAADDRYTPPRACRSPRLLLSSHAPQDPTTSLPFVRETLQALRKEIDGQATMLGFVGANRAAEAPSWQQLSPLTSQPSTSPAWRSH